MPRPLVAVIYVVAVCTPRPPRDRPLAPVLSKSSARSEAPVLLVSAAGIPLFGRGCDGSHCTVGNGEVLPVMAERSRLVGGLYCASRACYDAVDSRSGELLARSIFSS